MRFIFWNLKQKYQDNSVVLFVKVNVSSSKMASSPKKQFNQIKNVCRASTDIGFQNKRNDIIKARNGKNVLNI